MTNIAILIPLCSKKQDYLHLGDVDFFQLFLNGWNNCVSKKHNYRFYIGYDENDEFFIKEHDKLIKRVKGFGEIIVLPKSCNGSPCKAWNILYEKAYNDGHDYFYQCGSDIIHGVKDFDDYFVSIMKKNDDDCICGGVDAHFWMERVIRNQNGILENVFTGRKHYERFKFFFPPEVDTWFSDDMITRIYLNHDKCFIAPNIKYSNANRVGGHNDKSRYTPPEDKPIAKTWRKFADEYSKKIIKI